MRPSGYDEGSHSHRSQQSGSTTPQNGAPSSSYVSTLSNALNITPKPKIIRPESHLSAPAKLARATSTPKHGSPLKAQALHTPTRNKEPPPILSLSGHEVFQSPNTPGSPWVSASTTATEVSGHVMTHGQHFNAGHTGQTLTSTALDHDWFTSAPSSSRTPSIFETSVGATAMPSLAAPSTSHAQVRDRPTSVGQNASDKVMNGSLLATTSFPPVTFAGYRDASPPRDSSDMRSAGQFEKVAHSSLSPASAAALSPAQISSTVRSSMMDESLLSSIFEHETPSLSTHLLPNDDLTEYLQVSSLPVSSSGSGVWPRLDFTGSFVGEAELGQQVTRTSPGLQPMSAAFGQSAHLTSSQRIQSTPIDAAVTPQKAIRVSQPSETGLFTTQPPSLGSNAGGDSADIGMPNSNHMERNDPISSFGDRLAGLGLELNAAAIPEHVEVLMSPMRVANRPSVAVDEMGRWMLDPQSQHSEFPWPEVSTGGSKGTRDGWAAHRTSMASISASTEASFTSQSNSSTWDSSFNEPTSPSTTGGVPSASAETQSVSTPASSVGFSSSRNPPSSKFADQLRISSDARSPVATPEVAMHDFSEFGQSVSIEQMAEERWRTWPRNAVGSMQRDTPTSAPMINSAASSHSIADEPRASFDSLSVSTSSTRSRLMAEPYNKNMRSGRPSSSASTSSRSSIGNAAALEAQQTSGGTGPSRPRSFLATGSLRMSSTTRSTSNGGAVPDTNQSSGERISGTALALRRARGMSHSVFPSSSSSPMKSTRSADAFMSLSSAPANVTNFRHSVGMQRAATSVDAPRPQSMLDTSSHSQSPRQLGVNIESKAKGRVGFNEVSAALDTLRMFLKQKGGSATASTPDPSTMKMNETASPNKPSRTLRRAKGVLPPRGVVSHVDEFGALHTSTPSADASALNDTPGASTNHKRSQSLGAAAASSQSSRQDDRLAVLEDVSERVLRLKAETELEKERHAAASMPPPTARPASMMHSLSSSSRMQSNMTRREMHEQYLRKRASGS